MGAVLEAIARGGLKVAPLITHRFPFLQAESAYELVSGKRQEPFVGIVLQYPEQVEARSRVVLKETAAQPAPGLLRVGFAGAGSFARTYLLPHLKGRAGVELVAVATAEGHSATDAARKFGFAEAVGDASALIRDDRVGVVFIATRHDLHGPLARMALAAGKHVYVEKPLAVSPAHLAELLPVAQSAQRVLQVGFNRRFSPLAAALHQVLAAASGPKQVTYRVNAGPLPAEHWSLNPEQGGGRMVGEGCHFIDLIQFLTGEAPARVTAAGFGGDARGATSVLIEMSGGSVGVLVYQANASGRVPKERVEAFCGGRGGIVHDWRWVELFDGRGVRKIKARGQAKGFAEEIVAFLEAVRTGKPAISLESQALTTAATFAVLRSIADHRPIEVTL
jgi:polar amino acid transport system substrate-binding protein